MATKTSFIAYRGPSMLDGKPIALVVTTKSRNDKTGNMVQTWIIPDNGQHPHEAIKTGADVSVCGDCKHRQGLGGSCYVNLGQGPRAVAAALMRGSYGPVDLDGAVDACSGRAVRIGSYGDPAAVPFGIWLRLTNTATSWTGYTHQWRDERFASLRGLVMASCDTPEERRAALEAGWRTFRVRMADQAVLTGEFVCPASEEAGYKRTCVTCRACDGTRFGTSSARAGSPVIVVHGALASRFAKTLSRIPA